MNKSLSYIFSASLVIGISSMGPSTIEAAVQKPQQMTEDQEPLQPTSSASTSEPSDDFVGAELQRRGGGGGGGGGGWGGHGGGHGGGGGGWGGHGGGGGGWGGHGGGGGGWGGHGGGGDGWGGHGGGDWGGRGDWHGHGDWHGRGDWGRWDNNHWNYDHHGWWFDGSYWRYGTDGLYYQQDYYNQDYDNDAYNPSYQQAPPTFSMALTSPTVHVGEMINVQLPYTRGTPPFTILWKFGNEQGWTKGGTTFQRQATSPGDVVITAMIQDAYGVSSKVQSVNVKVLPR